jgi:protein-disulfide isomerase-like protein with CxxC motif
VTPEALGLAEACEGVLLVAELHGVQAFGPLGPLLVDTATLCRALVAAPERAPLHELPTLLRWSRATLHELRGRAGTDAEAARRLVGAAGRLAAEVMASRMPAARPS